MSSSTDCHFDHISGIEAFHTAGAEIVASGHNKTFLAPENRDDSSLCSAFGLELPNYKIDRYVKDGERLKHKGKDLGLKVIHTPGHTPDQMAVFDEEECWLFTGDTIYQRAKEMPWGEVQDVPIILVGQGNWTDYVRSLKKLQDFIQGEEGSRCAKDQCAGGRKQIHLGAGHTTQAAPALQFIKDGREFVARVVDGDVPIIATLPGDEVAPGGTLGDENFLFWQDDGEPLFSILAPERFQKDFPGSRQYLPKVPSSAGDEAER